MAWKHQTAKVRIETHLANMPEIEIKKLEKNADLENLLTETTCREIYGTHLYLDIANFSRLTAAASDQEKLRPLIRAIHIWQRRLAGIVENIFDGVRVHFQGARLHVIFYRPIDDERELSTKALLLMMVTQDFLRYAFNPLFPDQENLYLAGGADLGTVIGTRNGMKGDRELLFLGDAANRAAKILNTGLRLTQNVYDKLAEDLQSVCGVVDEKAGIYRLEATSKDEVTALCEAYGVTWDREDAAEKVEADIEQFPLDDIEFSSATETIDFDTLSIFNNKHVIAASIFADLTDFTSFIAGCATDTKKQAALKAFHVIRCETARVVRHDFDALRVQYQGDRLQALVHLPEDDEAEIARKAVEIAIGLQSSMELLKDLVDGIGTLNLAVGIDLGDTVATRLGKRAHRDRIVLGTAAVDAEANEERTEKRQIGISKAVYDELEEEIQEHFVWSATAKCYVATGLTYAALERKAEAATYRSSASVSIGSTASGIVISRKEVAGERQVSPSWSHAAD
jgi:adenylate/guanylate cyclase family protein